MKILWNKTHKQSNETQTKPTHKAKETQTNPPKKKKWNPQKTPEHLWFRFSRKRDREDKEEEKSWQTNLAARKRERSTMNRGRESVTVAGVDEVLRIEGKHEVRDF